MDIFVLLIAVAILVEAVVLTIRMIYDSEKRQISFPVIISLVVGIVISFGLKLNIFSALPLAGVPPDWLGWVVTGILISRGSNFVHDLWGKLTSYKT